MDILSKLKQLYRKKFIRYGIPFMCLVVGGSFGLREFTQIKFQFKPTKKITPEEAEKYGVKMKNPKEVTLESEYEKIKELDIEHWENIRGPRPWEEGTTKNTNPL
ncbi:cytochrome c oxidase assembly protein COX16 homolog, mitochondrial [Chrysoperla carnea]|uniref:cytochrome c oxidase assembly protein COX16 homolog, mitochondrial n=1 Tax=Chrysoperla carnea TaxID=189513 RepID=UPI001D070AAF|nr:cytochrome c oxidase assembly protein COX16 homolog, mitochondrial [Chrysoperla carnea]